MAVCPSLRWEKSLWPSDGDFKRWLRIIFVLMLSIKSCLVHRVQRSNKMFGQVPYILESNTRHLARQGGQNLWLTVDPFNVPDSAWTVRQCSHSCGDDNALQESLRIKAIPGEVSHSVFQHYSYIMNLWSAKGVDLGSILVGFRCFWAISKWICPFKFGQRNYETMWKPEK